MEFTSFESIAEAANQLAMLDLQVQLDDWLVLVKKSLSIVLSFSLVHVILLIDAIAVFGLSFQRLFGAPP